MAVVTVGNKRRRADCPTAFPTTIEEDVEKRITGRTAARGWPAPRSAIARPPSARWRSSRWSEGQSCDRDHRRLCRSPAAKTASAREPGVEDREAGLEVGRLDVSDEAPFEAGAQAVLEGRNLLGRPVGGDDDLLVDLVQRIEGVEELLLGPVLAGQELHVVDQQHV